MAPRAKSGGQMLEESDREERPMTHGAHGTDILSTNIAELVDLSQSDGEKEDR